jgi:predicted DNA-binding transcriptional regulator AlpA
VTDPRPHLRALAEALPPGSAVPVPREWLLELLAPPFAEAPSTGDFKAARDPLPLASSWRERLWTVPADTRLGVIEVAEAMGRPKSWVYRRTSVKSGKAPLPHRKLDGELVFVAGDVRAWLKRHEIPSAKAAA